MSFSFTVRAATKADAKAQVEAKMAEVVVSQPTHDADQQQVVAVAGAYIDLLKDDEGCDVIVAVSGYLSWDAAGFTVSSVSVNASAPAKA